MVKRLNLLQPLLVSTLASTAIMALVLFAPARTLNWPSAWIILGLYVAGTVLGIIDLSRNGGDLLRERMKPPFQRGQPISDKIVLAVLVLGFYGMIVFAGLDVFHMHLLRAPPMHIQVLGLVMFFSGWTIAWAGLRENAFAANVVRLQKERQQTVVDTGVYRVVRHPMYSGGALVLIGLPLWLGSYAATVFAIIPIASLIIRIAIEEQLLNRELPGYSDYKDRVRSRLIPFIW